MTPLEKAKRIKSRYEKQWLKNNYVISIGIGQTENNEICIVIGVRQITRELLDIIPSEIEDILIRLVETERPHAL